MSKNRVRCSNPPMASQRQIKPAAHAISRDRCVKWSRGGFDGIHQALTHLGKLQARWTIQDRNFVEIGSRRKKILIARDDQRPHTTRQRLQRVGKFQNAWCRQPVHAVVRLKAQHVNAIDLFDA
jgi:hypothetical protein